MVQELSSQSKASKTPGSSDDVKEMYEILKRIECNEPMDSESDQEIDSDLSDEELDEELDSDDDDDSPAYNELSKRLEGIDLNDADAIWSKLTESERHEFSKIVQSEDVTSILPKFNAWWGMQAQRKLVTELNEDEKCESEEESVKHPTIIESIVDFARISTRAPAPCVRHNLMNVLASYTSMVRFFYGEHETSQHEAVSYLIAVCSNFRTNANFDDSDLAIESVRQDALNEGHPMDEFDVRQMHKDVDHLMEGPIQGKQTSAFVLAALSDLHRLLSKLLSVIKAERKSTQLKPTVSSKQTDQKQETSASITKECDKFSKRFSTQNVNSCHNLEKTKLTEIIRKIEYYLAYVKKYH